jgi:hypothetical protein
MWQSLSAKSLIYSMYDVCMIIEYSSKCCCISTIIIIIISIFIITITDIIINWHFYLALYILPLHFSHNVSAHTISQDYMF